MKIAPLIKQAREARGWSQRELAKRMNVQPSAVAQWETDVTKPSVKNRADLSKMLEIPFIKLLPELATTKGIGVNDQEVLAIVQQLLELPAPVRQGLLMGVAATIEALRGPDRPE